jgi:uncharacterized protein (DUF1697 family)
MIQVAFLRAVNVGRRTVKMARLAELVGQLGYDGTWTHINSGNVVVDAPRGRAAIEDRLETAFEQEFGFEVTTFVRTAAELHQALEVQPFTLAPGDTYFVTFLKESLSKAQASELEALNNDFDTLVVAGRDVHWRMRGRSTDTRIPSKAWEAVVGRHRSTSRNTTMLTKLVAKLDARR